MQECGVISNMQRRELSKRPPKTLLAQLTTLAYVHPLKNPKHVPGIKERRKVMGTEGKLLVVLLGTGPYLDYMVLAARGYRLLVTNAGVARATELMAAYPDLSKDDFLRRYFDYQELMRREYAALHNGRLRSLD